MALAKFHKKEVSIFRHNAWDHTNIKKGKFVWKYDFIFDCDLSQKLTKTEEHVGSAFVELQQSSAELKTALESIKLT